MKNKVLVLGLVFFFLVCSGILAAKERRGAELVVMKTDGQQIKGELITVKPSSLLLLDSQSGIDVSVEMRETKEIIVFRKSKTIEGILTGLLVGSGVGALIGNKIQEGSDIPVVGPVLGTAIIGGVSCAVVGGLIGWKAGKAKTIQITGKSDSEIKEILERLRREARVTDAQ